MPTYLDTLPTELLHHIDRHLHRLYMRTLRYELLEFKLMHRSYLVAQKNTLWFFQHHSWTIRDTYILFKAEEYASLQWIIKYRLPHTNPNFESLIAAYLSDYASLF